ncbi:hypothetical protein GN958_ATG15119, partial [Phytophthora infestans]
MRSSAANHCQLKKRHLPRIDQSAMSVATDATTDSAKMQSSVAPATLASMMASTVTSMPALASSSATTAMPSVPPPFMLAACGEASSATPGPNLAALMGY